MSGCVRSKDTAVEDPTRPVPPRMSTCLDAMGLPAVMSCTYGHGSDIRPCTGVQAMPFPTVDDKRWCLHFRAMFYVCACVVRRITADQPFCELRAMGRQTTWTTGAKILAFIHRASMPR